MSNLKFLKNDYVPTGELAGYPLEIIDKMIEEQVRQINKPDVSVFENHIKATDNQRGFYWGKSLDGYEFWSKVINKKRFDIFFEKYPRTELPLLRVIEVRDSEEETGPKYKPYDFSDGVLDYSYIIDKIIINKNNNMMFKAVNLFYDDILKSSHINDFECENLFKNYTFEDGSPVGVRIN